MLDGVMGIGGYLLELHVVLHEVSTVKK